MTTTWRVVCASVLSSALLLAAAPAQAGTWSHTDPSKDVRRGWIGQPYVRVPGEKFGDIQKWSVRHTTRKVFFTLHARDLRRDAYAGFEVWIKVPSHTYEITSDLNAVNHGDLFDPIKGVPVDCAKFEWKASFKHNLVTAEVPRSCLDKPEWVRFGVVFRRGWKDADGGLHEDYDYGTGPAGLLSVRYGPRVASS